MLSLFDTIYYLSICNMSAYVICQYVAFANVIFRYNLFVCRLCIQSLRRKLRKECDILSPLLFLRLKLIHSIAATALNNIHCLSTAFPAQSLYPFSSTDASANPGISAGTLQYTPPAFSGASVAGVHLRRVGCGGASSPTA